MAYQDADFDATLTAAAGDDPALRSELRAGFVQSMESHIDLLQRARCDGNWHVASMRLLGLASGFHCPELIVLARQATDSVPGDPAIIRKLNDFAQRFPR